MRLDQNLGVTAADLVNGLSKDELADLLYALGDERFSRQISKAILEKRKKKKFETTQELVETIESVKRPEGKIHPATKTFQALRIAVNDELGTLERILPTAVDLLNKGGQIAVISFHSGEDRIVKNIFKCLAQKNKIEILTKKPVQARFEEIRENPRSRSARLRVAKRR
jgi:16S rRNA (cytosine1402-N4)-methyltransferase